MMPFLKKLYKYCKAWIAAEDNIFLTLSVVIYILLAGLKVVAFYFLMIPHIKYLFESANLFELIIILIGYGLLIGISDHVFPIPNFFCVFVIYELTSSY